VRIFRGFIFLKAVVDYEVERWRLEGVLAFSSDGERGGRHGEVAECVKVREWF
jgi:hypothetical protein